MAKFSGTQFALLLVDGYNIVTSLSESASIARESITQQTNAFNATNEEHTPMNVEKGELNVGAGFFDATTNALLGVYNATRGLKRIICAAIEGNTIGKHFVGFEGVYDQKYILQDYKDQLTKADLTMMVSGVIEDGVIVQDLIAVTADKLPPSGDTPVDNSVDPNRKTYDIASNSLANPTVITMKTEHGSATLHGLTTGDKVLFSGSNSTPSINGEQTVTVLTPTTFSVPVNVTVAGTTGSFVRTKTHAGGAGYLQVTAYSGFTNTAPVIMHSPDDTTYAALVTFTTLGTTYTPSKERIVVSGNVDRYVSSKVDVTGTGSVTLFMGFCRY